MCRGSRRMDSAATADDDDDDTTANTADEADAVHATRVRRALQRATDNCLLAATKPNRFTVSAVAVSETTTSSGASIRISTGEIMV